LNDFLVRPFCSNSSGALLIIVFVEQHVYDPALRLALQVGYGLGVKVHRYQTVGMPHASGKLFVEHLARALAVRFRQLSGGLQGHKPSQSGKMPTRILQRVLDRMRADFATNLDLHTIAAESGYSRTHFLRIFRASTGYSAP
jgi:hypothetical protein